MNDALFHVRTAFLMLAILGVLQALGSWIALRANSRQALTLSQRLWVSSSLMATAMGLVIWLRGEPAWLPNLLASHLFMLVWLALAWSSLRLERQRPMHAGAAALLIVLSLSLYAALLHLRGEARVTPYPALVAMVGALVVASQARALARSESSDGARLTTIAFSLTALVVLVRGAAVLFSSTPATSVSLGASQVLMALGGTSIFVLGNLGYLGLQIERLTRQRLLAEVSQARAEERNWQAQARVDDLQALLEERDLLIQRLHRLDAVQRQALVAAALPHELRQPLGDIRLNLDALAQRLARDGRVSPDLLQALDNDAQRLSEMVEGFMDQISRPAAQEPAELLEGVDVGAVVQGAMAVIEPRARRNQVLLQLVLDEPLQVTTSAAMLHQVVLILLTNALDAVSSLPPPRRVQVRITLAPGEVQVSVKDDGPGIAAHVWPHLFEPFASSKVAGAGVGLALARRLARRSGANVSARASSDDPQHPGACFTVHLSRP